MVEKYLATQLDTAVDEFGREIKTEITGSAKKEVDKVIKSIADKAQEKFISKIGDETLRTATSATVKKLASVDGLIGAFNSIQGNSGIIHETFGEMGRDIEKFIGGKMTRAELMSSLANRAENCITDTVEKMATTLAAEFGPLAPAVGQMAGYIAGKMFRNAVAPFINAAREAQIARERYEQLHPIYEEAIAQMESARQQFIEKMTEIFGPQEQLIEKSLDELANAFDSEKVTAALNNIASGIGGQELEVKSFDDFKNKIKNRKKLVM